jgi:hypothetical protein
VLGTNTASPTATPTLPGLGNSSLYSYPNPYVAGPGRSWRLRFDPCQRAEVELWDWAARKVMSLDPSWIQPDLGYASWDGRLRGGDFAAPGVYFVVLKTEKGQRSEIFTVVWP